MTYASSIGWTPVKQVKPMWMSILNTYLKENWGKGSVVRKFRTTASEGKNYNVEHYNLNMVISLGYRIKSSVATSFRICTTQRLREYLVKVFTIDSDCLKNQGGSIYRRTLDTIRGHSQQRKRNVPTICWVFNCNRYAWAKHIVSVRPTTLLATLSKVEKITNGCRLNQSTGCLNWLTEQRKNKQT